MVGVLDMPANTATPQKESFFAKILSWRKKKINVRVVEQVKVAEDVVVKETNQDQAVMSRIEKHVEATDRLVVPLVQLEGMVAKVEDVEEYSVEKEWLEGLVGNEGRLQEAYEIEAWIPMRLLLSSGSQNRYLVIVFPLTSLFQSDE